MSVDVHEQCEKDVLEKRKNKLLMTVLTLLGSNVQGDDKRSAAFDFRSYAVILGIEKGLWLTNKSKVDMGGQDSVLEVP